jgi:DNA invertase Pin-like site-specific DNA recombinase
VRFIAIQDNVDSAQNSTDNDFTPLKNLFNEWFCRDTSRKVRAVKKSMAMQGKHASSVAPYGYKPSEEDKFVWAIDEIAAPIVQEMFQLYIDGLGPFQIARILENRKVPIPRVHAGRWKEFTPKFSEYNWCSSMVDRILANREYTGDAVMSRYTKVSYKSTKQNLKPDDEWIIHENAHPKIIDKEMYEIVQRLRAEGRQKILKMEEPKSPLHGSLFCDTCGYKLYICRGRSKGEKYQYFVCGKYRGKSRDCTNHSIRTDAIENIILTDIRRIVAQVIDHEQEFIDDLNKSSKAEIDRVLSRSKSELTKAQNRLITLEKVIKKSYEDNVTGKLSDEMFAQFISDYETERVDLKTKIAELQLTFEELQSQNSNIEKFVDLVKRHTEITELTTEIVREFIERVEVGQWEWVEPHRKSRKGKKKKKQEITIFYNYVGVLSRTDE